MFLTAVCPEGDSNGIRICHDLGKRVYQDSSIEEKMISIAKSIDTILFNIEVLEKYPNDPSYGNYHAWAYSVLKDLHIDATEIGLEVNQGIIAIINKLYGFSLAKSLSYGLEGMRHDSVSKYQTGLEYNLIKAHGYNIKNKNLGLQIDTFPATTYLARFEATGKR